MSFFDNLGKMAADFGGASPAQAADAASQHVQNMDDGELAGHLTQSLPNMSQSTLSGLGQQLLSTFTNHAGFGGDANGATQEAGVSQAAVAAGEPGAVGMLLQFAQNHPGILPSAASDFVKNDPGVIAQFAPGLLQGIMGRLGGR